jgi:undecaprenyl-diphosphatase
MINDTISIIPFQLQLFRVSSSFFNLDNLVIPCCSCSFFDLLIQQVVQIDTLLFSLGNIRLRTPLFDRIMPVLTEKDNWWGLIVLVALLLAIPCGKKGRIALITILCAIAASDQLSSAFLKPLVDRVRPCHVIEHVHLLVNCSSSPSFPSSHAANMTAFAIVLSRYFRQTTVPAFCIALSVAYSRVYVGVHYPFDAAGGICIGILSGYAAIGAMKLISRKITSVTARKEREKT